MFLAFFYFHSKNSLQHFLSNLVMMLSLSFCLFGEIFIPPSFFFIPPSFLNNNFTSYTVLHWLFFFLSIFWMYYPIPFGPEKFPLSNGFMGVLLYVSSLFSCCFQNSFFVFDFRQLSYNVSWYRPVQVQSIWNPLGLLELDVHFFPKVWEVFSGYCLI